MIRFLLLIAAVVIFFSGCNENPQNRMSGARGNSVHSRPSFHDGPVYISPEQPVTGTIISIGFNKSITGSLQYRWFINGILSESKNSTTLATEDLKKGDMVHAVVIRGNNQYRSNEIVIHNTPPAIIKSHLLPEFPVATSVMTLQVESADKDNDPIHYVYKWFINNEYVSDDSYLETDMKRNDEVKVEITPSDGHGYGKAITLKKTILNSLPQITDSSPVIKGSKYTYKLDVTDPDGDELRFDLLKNPEGMEIDSSKGVITWDLSPDKAGAHEVEVAIHDNHGGEIMLPFTTSIIMD